MEDFISPAHEWLRTGKAVETPGPLETPCWVWIKTRSRQGYAVISIGGESKRAHRIAINAPDGLCALHECDNPACVNPKHLRIGTLKDNSQDKKIRNRGLLLGVKPRCACGRSTVGSSKECSGCLAIRKGKPRCHCGEVVRTKGLCDMHYMRHWVAGTLPEKAPKPVVFCHCGEVAKHKGMCSLHYYRALRPSKPRKVVEAKPPCHCGRPHYIGGLCSRHYNREYVARKKASKS